MSDGNATTGVNFDLAEGAEITGRVTSAATGQNLGGVAVSLVSPGSDDIVDFLIPRTTVTATNGEYRLSGLWPGTYLVQLEFRGSDHAQYAPEFYPGVYRQDTATPQVVALGQSINGIDFDAEVGGAIEGRVLRADNGLPMKQIDVVAVPDDIALSTWWYDFVAAVGVNQSDEDGRYRLTGLPPGDYKLVAFPEPFLRFPVFDLAADEPVFLPASTTTVPITQRRPITWVSRWAVR